MDALAVKQACKFAKEHALKNGPIVSSLSVMVLTTFISCTYLDHVSSFWAFYMLSYCPKSYFFCSSANSVDDCKAIVSVIIPFKHGIYVQ